MMNRLKLLFLSLLTPLLCLGVSFGAGLNGTYITQGNGCNGSIPPFDVSNYDFVCVVPAMTYFESIQTFDAYDTSNYNTLFRLQGQDIQNMSEVCFKTNGAGYISFNYQVNNQGIQSCNYGNSRPFNYEIYGYSMGGGGNSSCESDLAYCESKLLSTTDAYNECKTGYNDLSTAYSSLSGNYANCLEAKGILSGQLATCTSDLSSCTNSCDSLVSQCQLDKNACLESYNTCTGDLQSMTNYSDSLSTQLNECLAELPVPCEGTGCDEIVSGLDVVFSFFWENEGNMFSLPIGNNVFLPQGYRAYVDSGVVAITEIDKRKIKIDEGSDVVNETYYSFIMGIIMLLIFSLFAYYMKKFISKFFIPKETKG